MEIIVYANLVGEKFSPSKIEQLLSLSFSTKNEPGEIGKTGRYKDKETPYGSICLDPEKDLGINDSSLFLEKLTYFLKKNHKTLLDNGCEDIDINITLLYKDQCNYYFAPELLTELASLELGLSVSCERK